MYKKIQSIFNNYLDLMPDRPNVAWENTLYAPDETEIYLEPKLFPGQFIGKFIGDVSTTYNTGLYQINVVAPKGGGWGDIADIIEDIEAYFYKGLVLTDGDMNIRIKFLETSPGMYNSDGRYVMSVSIYYYIYYKP